MAQLAATVPASDAATTAPGRRSRLLPDLPYPGIRPFIKKEWPIFCGRQRIVDELLDIMVKDQFVPVLGTSGCGKSSIIKAGLIATLEREYSALGAPWRSVEMRPGNTPMWCLAEALWTATHPAEDAHPTPEQLAELRALLGRGPNGIDRVLKEYGFPSDLNLLLLVDQFEELFRFGVLGGEAETRTFLDQLLDVYESQPPGIHIVLTMRVDFISDCSRWPRLAMALNKTAYLLRWMTDDELREAIATPALLYRGKVQPELVERIVRDSGGKQDQLPVIEHALMWMWDRVGKQSGATLTLADYVSPEVGGIDGALSRHADQIYEGLSNYVSEPNAPPRDLRPVAKRLFQALTDVDSNGRAIRRPCSFSDLCATIDCQPAELLYVIDAFRKAGCSFLMPDGDTAIKDTDMIDVSHEALIRQWSKMKGTESAKGWLEEERQNAEAWRSLANEAATFHDDKSYRLSSRQTERFRAWWTRQKPSVAWTARYSRSGGSLYKNADTLLYLSARRQRLVRFGAIFLAVVVGASLLSTGILLVLDSNRRAADLVLSNTDLVEVLKTSKGAMTTMAMKAAKEWRSTDALVLARTAIKAQYAIGRQFKDQLTADRLNPSMAEGAAYWALTRHFLMARHRTGNAWDWTSDGKVIAKADRDEIQLINAQTGEPVDKFAHDKGSIGNLDISPDAQRVAVSNPDALQVAGSSDELGAIEIWDAKSGDLLKAIGGWGSAHNLFFSPDNRWIGVSDDNQFGVIDTQNWTTRVWKGHIPTSSLVFSPDSRYVAFVSDSSETNPDRGQATVVSLGDEVALAYQDEIGGSGGLPVFVPTTTLLAVPVYDNSSSGKIRFIDFGKDRGWNLDAGEGILPTAVAFDGAGRKLVVATESGELRLLEAFSEQSSSASASWKDLGKVSEGTPTSLHFFPDGSAMLVHTYGGSATIVDSQSGETRGILYSNGANYLTTFIDNGRQILMDNEPTIGLWRSTPARAPDHVVPARNGNVIEQSTSVVGDYRDTVSWATGIVYDGNAVAGILAGSSKVIAFHRFDDSEPKVIAQTDGSGGERSFFSTSLNRSSVGIVDKHWDVWTMAMTADRPTMLGTLDPPPEWQLVLGSGIDGSVIAVSDAGTAQHFSIDGKKSTFKFEIDSRDQLLAVDADRRRLMVVHDDGQFLSILIFDTSGNGEPVNLPLSDPAIYPLPRVGAFSRDGRFAAIIQADGIIDVWDIDRRALVALMGEPEQRQMVPSFSPQGDMLDVLASDGSIYRWPLFPDTGKLEQAIKDAVPKGLNDEELHQMLSITPDDKP